MLDEYESDIVTFDITITIVSAITITYDIMLTVQLLNESQIQTERGFRQMW